MTTPAEIFKGIAETMGLGFVYGEGWLQSTISVNTTYPAIFMFPIKETGTDYANETFIDLALAFTVLKTIPSADFMSIDFTINNAHVKAMRNKCYQYLRKIRDHEVNNIPIFANTNLSNKTLQDIVTLAMFDNYVSGVYCEINVKMLNITSVC